MICGLLAGLALLFAGLWWDRLLQHAGLINGSLYVANGVATGLFIGLSLAVLPQLYPDGPLPGRLWKVLLGVAAGLVVVATLQYAYNFPTIDDQVEWYFWSTVVGLGELIALASLLVRWRRGSRLLRRQIVGFATVTMIMIAASFFSRELRVLRPRLPALSLPAFCRGHFCTGAARSCDLDRDRGAAVPPLRRPPRHPTRGRLRRPHHRAHRPLRRGLLRRAGRPLRPGRGSPLPLGGRGRGHRRRPGRRADAAAHPDRLERRFLGERGDPLRVLARLHATLSNGDEDENTVYTTITRTVAAAVRSPSVALALHRGPQIETVSVTGAEQDAALVLPLVYRGERMGEMRVSPRTPGEPYGRVDRALLDELANQTSALVYALRRDTELQSTRRQAWRRSPRNVRGWGATCTMASPRCWLEQGLRPRRCARE